MLSVWSCVCVSSLCLYLSASVSSSFSLTYSLLLWLLVNVWLFLFELYVSGLHLLFLPAYQFRYFPVSSVCLFILFPSCLPLRVLFFFYLSDCSFFQACFFSLYVFLLSLRNCLLLLLPGFLFLNANFFLFQTFYPRCFRVPFISPNFLREHIHYTSLVFI